MKNGSFKHRVLPFSLITIVFSIISSISICFGISNMRDSYNEISVYDNTNIDFIIPSPSKDQVNDLQEKSFVEEVLPYYYTKSSVNYRESTFSSNVMFFESFSNIEMSPYNQKRCIEKAEIKQNSMFVDYPFYAKTKCAIGNQVSLVINGVTLDFVISGIYEENSIFDGGAIAIQYSDTVKNAIMKNRTKDLPYSGAYLSSNSKEECKNYLYANYKPLGLLRERDEFDSQEAYDIYIAGFNSTNYSNEIVAIQQFASDHYLESNNLKNTGYVMAIIGCALSLVSFVALTLIMNNREKEVSRIKELVKKGEDKKDIFKYYLTSHFAAFILGIIVFAVSLLFIALSNTFIKLFPALTFVLIEASALILALIIGALLSFKKAKSFFAKKEGDKKSSDNA